MSRPVRLVGSFPPPVHGMSIATASLADTIEGLGVRVERVDILRAHRRRWVSRIVKVHRSLRAAWRVIVDPPAALLVGADSGLGILLQLPVVLAARPRRVPVFIFHHSPVVPRGSTWFGRVFVRSAGSAVTHVLLCQTLADEMRSNYGRPKDLRTVVVSNGHVFARSGVPALDTGSDAQPTSGTDESHQQRVRVGHLSNLDVDKGFAMVGDAVSMLTARGVDVTYHLAGEPVDETSSQALGRLRRELGGSLIEHGFVAGEAKARFFDQIDVFVFPSSYVNECSPLVVWEALHAGIPVISSDVGCLGDPTLDEAILRLEPSLDARSIAEAIERRVAWPPPDVSRSAARADVERSLAAIASLGLMSELESSDMGGPADPPPT